MLFTLVALSFENYQLRCIGNDLQKLAKWCWESCPKTYISLALGIVGDFLNVEVELLEEHENELGEVGLL